MYPKLQLTKTCSELMALDVVIVQRYSLNKCQLEFVLKDNIRLSVGLGFYFAIKIIKIRGIKVDRSIREGLTKTSGSRGKGRSGTCNGHTVPEKSV